MSDTTITCGTLQERYDEARDAAKGVILSYSSEVGLKSFDPTLFATEVANEVVLQISVLKDKSDETFSTLLRKKLIAAKLKIRNMAKAKLAQVDIGPDFNPIALESRPSTSGVGIEMLAKRCNEREREMLNLLNDGHSLQSIAEHLGISRTAVFAMKKKLALHLRHLEKGLR